MGHWIHVLWLGVMMCLSPALATAQSAQPLDIVIMKDGAMVRGTIVESVPDGHVTILLMTGESRTISWDVVRYAGPESERSTAPRPPSQTTSSPSQTTSGPPDSQRAAESEELRIQVTGDQRDLRLHRLTGQEIGHISTPFVISYGTGPGGTATWYGGSKRYHGYTFEPLCSVPCSLSLAPGRYEFGVSAGGGVSRAEPIEINRSGTLHIAYSDQSTWRILGWIVWPVCLVAGAIFMGAYMATTKDINTGMVVGLSTMLGGGLIGASMIFAGDGAVVRFD